MTTETLHLPSPAGFGKAGPKRLRRWITDTGGRSPELEQLIAHALAGATWADIADRFYPRSGNGIRKAVDIFGQYATVEEKTRRKAILKATRPRRFPHNPRVTGGGIIEPPLRHEAASMFEGMGDCFR